MKKEFLTRGDTLLALKNDLYGLICNRFAALSLDISTGLLVIDAVKADLQALAISTLMRRGDELANDLKKESKNNDLSSDQTNPASN